MQLDSSTDPVEVLKDVPQDMKCSEVADFLKRSMTYTQSRIASNRIRVSLEKKLVEDLKTKLLATTRNSFIINESTMCHHCSQPIGNQEIVLYPGSKKLAHKNCHFAKWSRDEVLS